VDCQSYEDPKRLRISFKSLGVALFPHEPVQSPLRDMTEGRVPEVVSKRGCFCEVRIRKSVRRAASGLDPLSKPPGDLGDLEGVGEPIVENVAFGRTDDLADLC